MTKHCPVTIVRPPVKNGALAAKRRWIFAQSREHHPSRESFRRALLLDPWDFEWWRETVRGRGVTNVCNILTALRGVTNVSSAGRGCLAYPHSFR